MMKNQKSKIKNQNYILKFKNFAFYIVILIFNICFLNFILCDFVYAQEITIIYTGETHAMLYPCRCPNEPDGGVARRATLIKQLRKDNPNTLVLDSGGFFAGGLMDEYTQNTELDMQRTLANLKAIELMKYDALTVGDDEFNFGSSFLLENIDEKNSNFLSCNISATNRGGSAFGGKSSKILPYIMKEISGLKIGIIGVTNISARQKAGDIEFTEPKVAVELAVGDLKKNNADMIILLSHLGEDDDTRLIKEIKGIDIVIVGHSRSKNEPDSKVDSTILVRPSWQGRRMGKLTITVEDKKIIDYKIEELRISDKISDDPRILSILPRCFSDNNCNKEGMIGACQDAGRPESECIFTKASKVSLLIITPRLCRVCDTGSVIEYLKTQFPGLVISYLYYPDKKAARLVRDFDIKVLPAYLLAKEAEEEKNFGNLRENLDSKGDFYMLKPAFSGLSYFVNRKKLKGKLDLFISLYDESAQNVLGVIREFNPGVHFLAIGQKDKFDAAKGGPEVEEYLRSVCIQKYYTQKFWDYITCRAKDINSSWWQDCLDESDTDKIRICAKGPEGRNLLKENISLNKELEVMFGPTYFLDNQEIFGLKGDLTKEEFKKILNK